MGTRIDPDKRFERLRGRAKQEQRAQTQEQREALQRRFTSLGLAGSGEAIKQEQLAEKRGGEALARRIGDIESAQETSALRRQEITEQREFQAGEALKGREFGAAEALKQRLFAGEQAGIGREFARGERIAGQKFGAEQAGLGREFAASQSELMRAIQERSLELQESQFGQQMELALEKFELDKEVTAFNQKIAEAEAAKKDLFEKIAAAPEEFWKNISGQAGSGGFATSSLFPGVKEQLDIFSGGF